MISPASGIHRPSYNGAPAMQTQKISFQTAKAMMRQQGRARRARNSLALPAREEVNQNVFAANVRARLPASLEPR